MLETKPFSKPVDSHKIPTNKGINSWLIHTEYSKVGTKQEHTNFIYHRKQPPCPKATSLFLIKLVVENKKNK